MSAAQRLLQLRKPHVEDFSGPKYVQIPSLHRAHLIRRHEVVRLLRSPPQSTAHNGDCRCDTRPVQHVPLPPCAYDHHSG